MGDNVTTAAGAIASDNIGGAHYQRIKVTFGDDGTATDVSSANPLPVSLVGGSSSGLTDTQLRASAVPVSGTFYQVTQPVSIASMPTTAVTGTFWQATQPISGTVSVSGSVAVTGTFYQATQPVSIASMPSTPVTGTFWQATQPVSGTVTANAGSGTFAVSGTFWQATQPVSGTFWQTTQPVSGTVTITPPTLTKGTQGATGLSVQELKDGGRSCLAMTAEFTFAQVAETLLTMTLSVDGAATSTFSSRVITNGKKFRLQSITIEVETLGTGTAPQRAYLRLRRNTAGATTASSALQAVWGCVNNTAIVKSAAFMDYEVPDGLEMNGDGTATFGFTLETPDWVTTTATGRAKITAIGFEY
jgi:hypothetical protein